MQAFKKKILAIDAVGFATPDPSGLLKTPSIAPQAFWR
ncbi:Uncharacterized protein ChrSV_2855 [Chromobacterium vaccinii]|nr:Uncharacterized protein ChrSW_2855 [Chromobacterium vaccinii]QND90312.1 Uncharacterized protein ChrSV_2855 [Chromobacterium vaccinii]